MVTGSLVYNETFEVLKGGAGRGVYGVLEGVRKGGDSNVQWMCYPQHLPVKSKQQCYTSYPITKLCFSLLPYTPVFSLVVILSRLTDGPDARRREWGPLCVCVEDEDPTDTGTIKEIYCEISLPALFIQNIPTELIALTRFSLLLAIKSRTDLFFINNSNTPLHYFIIQISNRGAPGLFFFFVPSQLQFAWRHPSAVRTCCILCSILCLR